ncbi:hypothetical protein L2E82_27067 [Cichorium intybus]|uniref:Uncharacterized protein n=1 Tax=Cichorium intybus TaxID=13427 RepID=A0ACB9CS46_CICIN|nr:hypothetical protein L2E82_27067 [Cichorium intybus]
MSKFLHKHNNMDVAAAMDFDFNSSSDSCGYYTSAPSSPTRLTDVYCDFDKLLIAAGANHRGCVAAVPFAWEEKPGVPKTSTNSFEDDFSFDVSSHFGRDEVSADDLFHGGVIKTVDSQPRLQEKKEERERGRERGSSFSRLPSSRSRRTRSLSPLGSLDQRREQQLRATYMIPLASSTCTTPAGSSMENGSKKWSFMDLFLFRSASDGRAMDRDPLKKYSATFRKHDQDIRNSGSVSKRRGRVSAHEHHYTVNRAVSNDMKKKTYLPYKQGILGRFSFNP